MSLIQQVNQANTNLTVALIENKRIKKEKKILKEENAALKNRVIELESERNSTKIDQ